jgi:hypothetical protein
MVFLNTRNTLHQPISIDIVSNMKTTIDIPDTLLQEAKKLASQKQITLRSLVEQGLREAISSNKSAPKFKLRRAGFRGNGLQSEFLGESWQKIREAAYEGHGG